MKIAVAGSEFFQRYIREIREARLFESVEIIELFIANENTDCPKVAQDLEKINAQTRVMLNNRPASLTEEKIFLTNSERGFGFYIDEVNNEKAEANHFLILNKQGNNPYPVIFLAKKAVFNPGIIQLQDVKGYSFDKEGKMEVSAEYKNQDIPISTFFSSDESEGREKKRSEMNLRELKEYHDKNIGNNDLRESSLKALIEIYQRLIGPLASTFLCWLGVLLSVGHRRSGRGISFGISLIIMASFREILGTGELKLKSLFDSEKVIFHISMFKNLSASFFTSGAGAFLSFGILAGLFNIYKDRKQVK